MNNQPTKHYLVSVVLASFWGFIGAKDWYNNNKIYAVLRISAAIVTIAAIILSFLMFISGIVPSILVAILCLWSVVDSIITHSGASRAIKEQKSRASLTDKRFATTSLIIGSVISLLLGTFFVTNAINSQSILVKNAEQDQVKIEQSTKFLRIKLNSTPDDVASIMKSAPTCEKPEEYKNIISGEITVYLECSYGNISDQGAATNKTTDATYTIRLMFSRPKDVNTFSLTSKEIDETLPAPSRNSR